MVLYSIERLAEKMKGQLVKFGDVEILYLIIDSRSVSSPEESLFFALKGERHNGHDYVAELFKKGVRSFVIESSFDVPYGCEEANYIKVTDTLEAFQLLAKEHRLEFNTPVIGITGSNGKTIVKEWLTQLIGNDLKVTRSPRSYNSQVGVPLSVWLMDEQTDLAIFEAGISQPGEMERLEKIIIPNIGLLTNFGQAHQENFISLHEKLFEKLMLFRNSQLLIYCKDQTWVDDAIRKLLPTVEKFTWGRSAFADLTLEDQRVVGDNTELVVKIEDKSWLFEIPFTDTASAENAMHAITLLIKQGFSPEIIQERIKTIVPVAMRLEQKEGINGCLVINDSYNSDITSLSVALDFLTTMGQRKGLSRSLILSDIFQSGMDERELYSGVAKLIKQKKLGRVIGIGSALLKYSDLFSEHAQFFASTQEFLASESLSSFRNEAILVKGSRNFHFERISVFLESKRHRTVMEINLNAFVHNLNYFRSKLKPHTKVLAMVKAFSYGSGSFEIASLLQHENVDYLGVAFADEGVELRAAGITLPIIVMNPEERSFSIMLEYGLEPEIFNLRVLESFALAVEREGLSSYPVHVKLETGMFRLGFPEEDVDRLIDGINSNPQLKVKSVFSHLVGSDDENHDMFTLSQIDKFKRISDKIELHTGHVFMRHILNSAGIERFPQAQFDMVRLGIGLYGVSAVNQDMLQNVATLKTTISQIKYVSASETIGYSRKGKLDRDAKIAIIPIGYADGLDRRLSNENGMVLVQGRLVPIVGNICMDMCMIDVSDVPVSEGDEVIIFGDELPFSKVADAMGTIPYELLTGISRRVKRIYFQE